mgnify:CR=1 FL=1
MKFLKKLKNKIFNVLGGVLLPPVELVLVRGSGDALPNPPIFFLGAPRSGTTLAMQVITDVFDLGYLSNHHSNFYGAPALAEKLFHPTKGRPRSSYRSVHGVTNASYAPSESSQWWYRFFRRNPRYVDLSGIEESKMLRFRKSVQSMLQACGRPVLYKNPHAALRIQPIVKYLPESLFIIMERDEVDNAHSLLEVRHKAYKDYQKWWSMEPPSIDDLLKLPAHEQVVEQIRHIHSTIEKDLRFSGVDSSVCFALKYEDLCNNPEREMNRLEAFFRENDCQVSRRCESPKPFPRRNQIRIDKNLYEKVREYAKKS